MRSHRGRPLPGGQPTHPECIEVLALRFLQTQDLDGAFHAFGFEGPATDLFREQTQSIGCRQRPGDLPRGGERPQFTLPRFEYLKFLAVQCALAGPGRSVQPGSELPDPRAGRQ